MTTWTERSAPPATVWVERSAPPVTSWTERNAPASSIPFLESPISFFRSSDNFFVGFTGRLGGLVPNKESDNFFILAGVLYPGTYFIGRDDEDFYISALR